MVAVVLLHKAFSIIDSIIRWDDVISTVNRRRHLRTATFISLKKHGVFFWMSNFYFFGFR